MSIVSKPKLTRMASGSITSCGKQSQESAAIGHDAPIIEKFCEEYGKRARLAAENRDIDWKAISHALRAAFQIKEILTAGTITFPLKEARLTGCR